MKVPISILCISDLHFNNEALEPIKQLGVDLLSYTNDIKHASKKRWIPDYIVVAGDITNQGNTDYTEPRRHIEKLLKEFHLDRKRVILVPGNHDKNTNGYDLAAYKKECALFDRYQKKVSKETIKEFTEHFSSKFSNYLSFVNDCCSDDTHYASEYYHYRNPELLATGDKYDEGRAKLLSGVRYFEEDSLCFFLINTEWLYIPPKVLMKENIRLGSLSITNNNYDELKYYLSIKENCKLCVPLINDAFNLIKKEYANCTVVTIMHRDFKDLTWAENNHTDPTQKDPIHQIEAVSDVILTGHDHSVKIEYPTFVKNTVQHFQIGSAGRDSASNEEPIRTACVININPAGEKIELLNAFYDGEKNNWSFKECERSFALRPKYYQSDGKQEQKKMNEKVTIQAKSIDDNIIRAEIAEYFNITSSDIVLYPIRYNVDTIKEELEKVYQHHEQDKILFVVIYRIKTNDLMNKTVETEVINNFKENHIMDIVCNRLIIKEIDIIVPNLVFFEKSGVLY